MVFLRMYSLFVYSLSSSGFSIELVIYFVYCIQYFNK